MTSSANRGETRSIDSMGPRSTANTHSMNSSRRFNEWFIDNIFAEGANYACDNYLAQFIES